ncbi:hypothetical protein GCM10022377_18630 [Zhihengliuella alba]|uniref:Uncharacterized protein n=1 Tax=Zhihengliuella alba TaxID=547018 RepID=A0ABP7DIM9_9MICC
MTSFFSARPDGTRAPRTAPARAHRGRIPRSRFVSAEAARRDPRHGVAVDVLLARHGERAVGFYRSRDFDVTVALLDDGSTDHAPNALLAPAQRRALAAGDDEIRIPGRAPLAAPGANDGGARHGGATRLAEATGTAEPGREVEGGLDGESAADQPDRSGVVAPLTDGGGPATSIERPIRGGGDLGGDQGPVRREEVRFLLKLTGVWMAASAALMAGVYWWAVTVSDVPLEDLTVGF